MLVLAGCSGESTPPKGTPSEQIVYRVEDLTQGGLRVTTQVVAVADPQRARSVLLEGEPPGGTSLGGIAFDAKAQYLLRSDGSSIEVQTIAPTFAGPVQHLDVGLATAVRHGQAAAGATASVAGMECTSYVSKEPLDQGLISPAVGGDTTTSCVSPEGLVLSEEWSLSGSVVRRRTAVTVGDGPDLTGNGLFGGSPPTPGASSQPPEQVKPVDLATLTSALGIPAPAAPLGLPLTAQVAVIQTDPGGGVAAEGGVLSWGNGDRLVVLRLERGLTAPVTVGTAGAAVEAVGRTLRVSGVAAGVRVRFAGPRGLVATVTGNVPEDDLIAWLATVSLG